VAASAGGKPNEQVAEWQIEGRCAAHVHALRDEEQAQGALAGLLKLYEGKGHAINQQVVGGVLSLSSVLNPEVELRRLEHKLYPQMRNMRDKYELSCGYVKSRHPAEIT
jgi:hypothetical protein